MSDTKVTYDVSDAIAKLNQLNKKVGEAGDKAVDAFAKKGTAALDSFVDGLSNVSPVAGKAVGGIRNLVAAAGPMGAVLGTAAAGAAAVVSNLIDLPGLLADSAGGMEAFNTAADRQLQIFEKFDDVNDAIEKSTNKRALRELSLRQAEIGHEQARLNNLKTQTAEELDNARTVAREKTALVEESVNRRMALEKKLADATGGQRVAQVERGALTKERAVGDLAAAAQSEALKGNVDLAEELRDRAQELTEELGGHVFFQKQVDSATTAITAGLQKQVAAEAKVQSGLEQEAALATRIANERERELHTLQERERLLRNETKEIRAARREITERETVRGQTDIADQGAGEVLSGIAKIRAEFEIGGRSVAENIKDSLRLSLSGLSSKARVDAGIATERDALQLVERISQTLLKPGGPTAQEVADIRPLVEKIGALTGALEVARGQGTLSAGQNAGVDQLNRFLKDFQQIAGGAAKFVGADRDPNAQIKRDSEGVLVAPARNLDSAATNLDRAAAKLAGVPTPSTVATASIPQTGQAAVATAVQGPTTINVNANVKGGIIDAETTRTITDIIRTELRKQTTKSL